MKRLELIRIFLDEQKKLARDRFNCSMLDGSLFESVILHNMNSFYAAWSMLQIVGNPILSGRFQLSYKQEEALLYIDVSIKEPDFGYTSLENKSPWNEKRVDIFENTGEGTRQLAKWKIEKGHALVALHPDFKYVDNIKIMIAINHLALGENQEGLNDLVEKGKPEASQWASKFLKLWQSKHPSPSPKANKR